MTRWIAPSRSWRRGPWSLVLRDDEIADLSYDGVQLLRSVRAVVRDRNWDTAQLLVGSVQEAERTLLLQVRSEELGSSFSGIVRVEAREDELLILTDLESAEEFWTNRTGLVLLHPPQLAGAGLTVTHSDGVEEDTAFPTAISPHQPVFDIAGLAWEHGGRSVKLNFSGDVFEMEDQRNWTDASFKTYSRPLARPFPYHIRQGERVQQSVLVRVRSSAQPTKADSDRDNLILTAAGDAFPAIGLGAATAPDPAPVAPGQLGVERLVELDLRSPTWSAALRRAAGSGLPLDVRFILDDAHSDALWEGVAALKGIPVRRVGAFQSSGAAQHVTDEEAAQALRRALSATGLEMPVIGGSRSHFTELNRERHRLSADLDGLATTVTPLFHALATEQLIESVAMQRLVAQQTVSYADGIPVHLGPVCLRPRFNNVATTPEPGPTRTDLSEGYGAEFSSTADARQTAPELAAWTVASAAALAIPGVASVAYFEEWGARGICSAGGDPYPVAEAIAALSALAGGTLLSGDSPDGLVWAIGSETKSGAVLLAANLDIVPRKVRIATPNGTVCSNIEPFRFERLGIT